MTDSELTVDELREILDTLVINTANEYGGFVEEDETWEDSAYAYQAILSWHNKEQIKLLERLQGGAWEITRGQTVVRVSSIESELTKLKGKP